MSMLEGISRVHRNRLKSTGLSVLWGDGGARSSSTVWRRGVQRCAARIWPLRGYGRTATPGMLRGLIAQPSGPIRWAAAPEPNSLARTLSAVSRSSPVGGARVTVPHTAEAKEEPTTVSRSKFLQGPVAGIGLFVVGYAVVDLIPVLLPASPGLFGLRLADLLDSVFIFVLVALYVRLGLDADLWRTPVLRVASAVSLVLLVQGHAIHLAANAIAAVSDPATRSWDLTYFLDEHWGHTELHLAFVLLAVLFIGYGRATAAELSGRNLSGAERVGQ